MKVKGTSQNFLEKLKKARKNKMSDLHKEKINYTEVFFIKKVYCETCKAASLVKDNNFIVAYSENDILNLAENEHTKIIQDSNIICTNPMFIIEVDNGLIDNRLLNKQTETKEIIM